MTMEEVQNLFSEHGFKLRKLRVPVYTAIEISHKGEIVGAIYEEEVYIVKNYPSLNDGSKYYADTEKIFVRYTQPMSEVEQAIDWLLDSPRRIDQEKRMVKIRNIRKYFKSMSAKELQQ